MTRLVKCDWCHGEGVETGGKTPYGDQVFDCSVCGGSGMVQATDARPTRIHDYGEPLAPRLYPPEQATGTRVGREALLDIIYAVVLDAMKHGHVLPYPPSAEDARLFTARAEEMLRKAGRE